MMKTQNELIVSNQSQQVSLRSGHYMESILEMKFGY